MAGVQEPLGAIGTAVDLLVVGTIAVFHHIVIVAERAFNLASANFGELGRFRAMLSQPRVGAAEPLTHW